MRTSRCDAVDLKQLAHKVGVKILADATSDKDLLAYTRSRLPFHRMSAGARQRANVILDDLSQYRRMPSLQYPVDTGIYQYLINHPDVAVATWRAMGISQLKMWPTAPFEYEAAAKDGSKGSADVLWRDSNQCVFIVEGSYNSPLLPNSIQASALVWLQYRFVNDTQGQTLVNQQVETFIQFPSAAVETIARLASRMTNKILDRNVFEVSLYARMMSQAVTKNPDWIARVAERMDNVPAQRRVELTNLAYGRNPSAVSSANANAVNLQQNRLTSSGEFRNFESSMNLLKQHAPLLPRNVVYSQNVAPQTAAATPVSAAQMLSTPQTSVTPQMLLQERRKQLVARPLLILPATESSSGRPAKHKTTPTVGQTRPLNLVDRSNKSQPTASLPTPMVFFSAKGIDQGSAKATTSALSSKVMSTQPTADSAPRSTPAPPTVPSLPSP